MGIHNHNKRPQRTGRSHGGVGERADDRVGGCRYFWLYQHRRTISPIVSGWGMESHIHLRRSQRQTRAYSGVDGYRDDCVGRTRFLFWKYMALYRLSLQPIDRHMDIHNHVRRPQWPKRAHGSVGGDADDRVGGMEW